MVMLSPFTVTSSIGSYDSSPLTEDMNINRQIIDIIGNIVKFTYIRNPNSVFGLQFGGPIISTGLTVIAFIFVMFLFFKSDTRFSLVGLSFIIGGALGNLTDRVLYMEVIDFIQVGARGWYWPTFNVADSCVTIGLILLIIYFLFIDTSHKETEPQDE